VTELPEDIERRIDGLLFIRHACRRDISFKTEALSTVSLRMINERLLQLDQEREAAAFVAEIKHSTIMLKAGISLGIVQTVGMQ
jgi:hypothetical protein